MRFDLDEQQRDFAASIDAALAAADLPGAVRAWAAGDTGPGRKVWARLADLGVTALAVPERFDGIDAHPVDLVVASERLGRWCVPGPVTESIAVAPLLLAEDERCAALATGELIATVALPPQVPRAVDADAAGLVLAAELDGTVREATLGERHESVDPSRRLFDVSAGESKRGRPMWHARTSSARWPPPPSWWGRARLCWTPRWTTPSSAPSSAGSSVRIKRSNTSWPMCILRSSWPAHWCTAPRCRWPIGRPTRPAT